MAGIQGVSATDYSTYTNVDLKKGEYLTAPSFGGLYVKGIQFPDKVGLKVGWDDYAYDQNYTVKLSISYDDLFDSYKEQVYYFDVTNETDPLDDYLDIPYMNINGNNTITIQILPYIDHGA